MPTATAGDAAASGRGWILGLPAVAFVTSLVTAGATQGGLILLPAGLLALCVAFLCLILAIAFTMARRWRATLSAVASLLLILATLRALPAIASTLTSARDTLAFERHRAAYEESVARKRAEEADGKPLRLVVSYDDRSLWVTANVFHYVIYDETDRAATDPNSLRNLVAGAALVRPLGGHFYDVTSFGW